jgi:WhiB family redox-sensing transcriptional regulator
VSTYDHTDWTQAACAGTDSTVFFGRPGEYVTSEGYERRVAAAKRICGACPVRLPCLEGAMERGDQYGVFGGMTEVERRVLARRRKRAQARESAA